jgi:hypoxanthine phosphoribosyltransferase
VDTVKILDKEFELFIPEAKIYEAIDNLAEKITRDLGDSDPIFLGILNGSFLFAAELLKRVTFPCTISFLKLASYQGTASTGKVKRLIGINEDIKDKTVIVLEDIIDTGLTMQQIKKQLVGYEPKEIKVVTLFFKPEAYQTDDHIDYVGMEIPNDFIVGFGLDYDGYGRNLTNVYKLKK